MVHGTYQSGKALDTSNWIKVEVNVTGLGIYIVSTSTVNGVTFSSSSNFLNLGVQKITLRGSGTPAADGTFNFSMGANGCSFPITFSVGIPPVSTGDCKECIYIPYCPGSKYEYSDTTFNPVSGVATPLSRKPQYLSSVDTTIGAALYKKLQVADGANVQFAYVNCTNGESTTIAYGIQSATSGNVLVAIKSIDLKANASVGTSWSDTATISGGNILYRKHTIVQKGFSRTVLGVTFNDVIKVNVVQNILYADPSVGLVPSGITDYYIAKGVGLIETIGTGENPLTGETYTGYHSVLKSYFIP